MTTRLWCLQRSVGLWREKFPMCMEKLLFLLVRLMQVGWWREEKLLVCWGGCISLNVLCAL